MQLLIILTIAAREGWQFQDYQGEDNPFVIYAAIALALLFFFIAFAYFIYAKWNALLFFLSCRKVGLSHEERSSFYAFLERFQISNPIEVIQSQEQFNLFMNRIGHSFEWVSLTEKELLSKIVLFEGFRAKFGFARTAANKNSLSTHDLTRGQVITVSVTDKEAGVPVVFESKIVHNFDLLLTITPPDAQTAKRLPPKKHLQINIRLVHPNFGEISFPSAYLRTIDFPNSLWCIKHVSSLETDQMQIELKVRSTLSFDDDGKAVDILGIIIGLTNRTCLFTAGKSSKLLSEGTGVLIGFSIDNKQTLALRASIEAAMEKPKTNSYKLAFAGLTNDEQKQLLQFANCQKKLIAAEQEGVPL